MLRVGDVVRELGCDVLLVDCFKGVTAGRDLGPDTDAGARRVPPVAGRTKINLTLIPYVKPGVRE